MTSIEIDASELQKRIDQDGILARLDEAEKKWHEKQEEKRGRYQKEIDAKRQQVDEINKKITELRRDIKRIQSSIVSDLHAQKTKYIGLQSIQKRRRKRIEAIKRIMTREVIIRQVRPHVVKAVNQARHAPAPEQPQVPPQNPAP